MSWKTTLCGVLALVGGLLAQFFPSLANVGHFLAALGPGLGLVFARDNDKTSEQVGAAAPKSNGLGLHLWVWVLVAALPLGLFATSGCQTTPQKAAYNAVNAPSVTAEQALKAWDSYCQKFTVPIADQIKVKVAYGKYQASALLAVDAAHAAANAMGGTNSVSANIAAQLTGQNASQALADLVNLLQTLGVKL